MRTLIISDLHLGSASGADLLRSAAVRGELLDALAGIDRLVLLGDLLELRHGPRRDALLAARPFFSALRSKLSGGELVLVAGNHDHALVERWLHRRAESLSPQPLSAQQLMRPSECSSLAAEIARWVSPLKVSVAYPGLWVRDDVYATHGHYLDCHLTVPTMERIAIAAMGRLVRKRAESFGCVDDYEAVCAPVYAWVEEVAAHGSTRAALNGTTTVAMWRVLHREEWRTRRRAGAGASARDRVLQARSAMRETAVRVAFPLAVRGLNRAGLGPLRPVVSPDELRRAGLAALREVAERLGLRQAHVVFGHTHRPGPLPGDLMEEWEGRLGARLYNCGSWTYSPSFLGETAAESPYWPGGCVLVEEQGPPQVRRLLAHCSSAELRQACAR